MFGLRGGGHAVRQGHDLEPAFVGGAHGGRNAAIRGGAPLPLPNHSTPTSVVVRTRRHNGCSRIPIRHVPTRTIRSLRRAQRRSPLTPASAVSLTLVNLLFRCTAVPVSCDLDLLGLRGRERLEARRRDSACLGYLLAFPCADDTAVFDDGGHEDTVVAGHDFVDVGRVDELRSPSTSKTTNVCFALSMARSVSANVRPVQRAKS